MAEIEENTFYSAEILFVGLIYQVFTFYNIPKNSRFLKPAVTVYHREKFSFFS